MSIFFCKSLRRTKIDISPLPEDGPTEHSPTTQFIKLTPSVKAIGSVQLPKTYSKLRFDSGRRLSLYAKSVGERAEEIVIKYLYETLQKEEKLTISPP